MTKQTIDVVIGAVFFNGKVLLVKRPNVNFNGVVGTAVIGNESIDYIENEPWFEFPGGKVDIGESEKTALFREINEEVGLSVEVGKKVEKVLLDVNYSNGKSRIINLHCFHCTVPKRQKIILSKELALAAFFDIATVFSKDDVDPLVKKYLSKINISK